MKRVADEAVSQSFSTRRRVMTERPGPDPWQGSAFGPSTSQPSWPFERQDSWSASHQGSWPTEDYQSWSADRQYSWPDAHHQSWYEMSSPQVESAAEPAVPDDGTDVFEYLASLPSDANWAAAASRLLNSADDHSFHSQRRSHRHDDSPYSMGH
eukprot:2832032-Amphidinium_carterae.1